MWEIFIKQSLHDRPKSYFFLWSIYVEEEDVNKIYCILGFEKSKGKRNYELNINQDLTVIVITGICRRHRV